MSMQVAAQPYCQVQTFNVLDGLPSNNISRVAQDSNGLLWIGTWNGISYFDGYRFASFKSGDKHGVLTTNRISDIRPDNYGHVWFTTYDRQPYLLNTKVAKFIGVKDVLKDKLPMEYTVHGIFNTSGHSWIFGDGKFPSVRMSQTAPENPDSASVVLAADLMPGASRIRSVVIGADGNEWVITDNGVACWNLPGLYANGNVVSGCAVGDNTFFATSSGDLYVSRAGSGKIDRMEVPAGIQKFNALTAGNGYLVASADSGVAIYDIKSGKWVHGQAPAGVRTTEVVQTNIDSAGRIWAFTSGGEVLMMDGAGSPMKLVPRVASGGKGSSTLHSIWNEDPNGTIWLAPRNGELTYFDEEERVLHPYLLTVSDRNNAPVRKIERRFIDNHGNLWLSTTHDLTRVAFLNKNFKNARLVQNEEARSLLANPDGSVWVGSYGGAIGSYSPKGKFNGYLSIEGDPVGGNGGVLRMSQQPVKFSDRVYAMYRDSRGRIWVGTKGEGLYIITSDGKVRNYRAGGRGSFSLPCDTIYSFDEDDRGNLWIGSYGSGLLMARDGGNGDVEFLGADNYLKTYPVDEFNRVRRITHNDAGVIAVSCTDGLVTFSNRFSRPEDIEFFTSSHIPGDTTSLMTSNVMQTLFARNGDVLVVTMGGGVQKLSSDGMLQSDLKFSDMRLPVFVADNNPGGGNVMSMIEDRDGSLYLIREAGIARVNMRDSVVSVFSPSWAGENVEFTEAAPVLTADGRSLWFGVVGGALLINPEELAANQQVPNIVFTGVQYQGESDRQKILNPDCIEINPDKRNFSLNFAALDYVNNYQIQYAYRLDDDRDWTYAGTSNSLQFTHLSPGIHRLYVKSTNSSGVWLDNQKYIDILVKPTFSESVWGRLLYTLLAVVVIGGVAYLYLLNRKSHMMKDFHEKEREFFIDASHRLRTPLTLISAPVNEVLNNENLSPTGRMHLEKVYRNSEQMLQMVNTMLSLRSGKTDYITDDTVPAAVVQGPAAVVPLHGVNEGTVSGPEPVQANENRTKLLVVEDNDDLRSFLHDILSAEYNVICASNGKIGLEKAQHEQPDFIITDVSMPEMDGLTMVHNIKRQKSLSHIPIIVLSAKASLSDRVEGLNAGIDDYITKPFSATYLRQRIANIISQRQVLQQTIFESIGREMQSSAESSIPSADKVSVEATAATGPSSVEPGGAGESAEVAKSVPESAASEPQAEPAHPEYRLGAPQIADADQEMMKKLLKFMEERISDEDLKIEELAEAVNMGRTVFYGKIKALVGMSPSDFLRRLRMQRAEELIVRSKMNFSQIAFNVGFSDPKYFTKCFKKETGMTPSEYRHKSQQRAEAPAADAEGAAGA